MNIKKAITFLCRLDLGFYAGYFPPFNVIMLAVYERGACKLFYERFTKTVDHSVMVWEEQTVVGILRDVWKI